MELHQLRCFYYAAKMQNMTKAATHMNMSQPALSIAIGKLEDELGVQLFDRNGRNIQLSRMGQAVLPHVETMLSYKDEIERICSEQNDKNTLYVKLNAASPVVLTYISDFSRLKPDVHIHVCETNDLVPDVIIDATLVNNETSTSKIIYQENIGIAVPRIIEPLPDISDAEELIYDYEMIGMSSRFAIGKCEEYYFKIHNLRIKHSIICDSIAVLRFLLTNGTGIACVPMKTWLLQNNQALTLISYPGSEWKRYITAERTTFRNNRVAAESFIAYAKMRLSEL